VRPLGRMQNKDSQQCAARLSAWLLCYCVRLVAAEDEEEQQQKQKKPSLWALIGIARLFPWHGRQRLAAQRLWCIVSRRGESADTAQEARKYVLRLSQATSHLRVASSTSSPRWA
jgi:site-specific recombinase XerD